MYELSLGTKKIVRLRLHIKRVSVKRGSTVYNRVRGWTMGQSIPVQNSVESPRRPHSARTKELGRAAEIEPTFDDSLDKP